MSTSEQTELLRAIRRWLILLTGMVGGLTHVVQTTSQEYTTFGQPIGLVGLLLLVVSLVAFPASYLRETLPPSDHSTGETA